MCFDRVFLNVLARVCGIPCMHMTIYREAQGLQVTNQHTSNLRYLWARANEQNLMLFSVTLYTMQLARSACSGKQCKML